MNRTSTNPHFLFLLFGFILFCLLPTTSHASHLVGADLTYRCLGGNNYELTLNLYRDCAGAGLGGSATINVKSTACGTAINTNLSAALVSSQEVSAVCVSQTSNTTCSGGSLPGIQQYTYRVNYTLPATCNEYIFSYSNCCRNYAISTGPGGNAFYVEAYINNSAAVCNSSPTFTALPVPYFCVNQQANYNHGAIDINGDSLTYSMVNPMQNATGSVTFTGPYNATYPIATTPANNYGFSATSGQMTFTPALVQQGVLAVRIKEFRNNVMIGYVTRDIQIVVINCINNSNVNISPIQNLQGGALSGTNTIRVCAGTPVSFNITASDPNAGTNISMLTNLAAAIPGATFTTVGNNPKIGTFNWTPTSASLGFNNFSLTVSDNNCPIPSIQSLGFTINVFGVDIDASDYTICPGATQNIQLDADVGGSVGCPSGNCYSWSPATGLSATNIPNPIATVSQPITYTVTYTDGVCTVSDQVAFVPEGAVTVTPAAPSVCVGNNVQLVATNTFANNLGVCGTTTAPCNGASTIKNIGTGTTFNNTSTTSVTPYNGFWHDSRMQILVRANELTAAGVVPGLIRSLAFNIGAKYSSITYNNFTIKMGCTATSTLTGYESGLTTVYTGNTNTAVGINNYVFPQAYQWDGVSNLVIEVCYDNTSYTSGDPVLFTTTAYTSVVYTYADNSSGCSMTGVLTSTARPNIRVNNCPVAPPVSYAWVSLAGDPISSLSNATIANPLASPTQTTTYQVAANNGTCTVYDTVTVDIALPASLNDIVDVTSCPAASVTLTATGINLTGFSWSNGATTSSITVNPNVTTTYTVTCTSPCGNLTDNVTVIINDIIPPVINNCPANISTTNASGLCGANVTWTAPTTTDNCSATISQTAGLPSGSFFPVGVSTITYTATDLSGNTATCSFTITVSDTQAPIINNCPANISVNNTVNMCGAIISWTAPTATDNCAGVSIAQTSGSASGSTFPLGTSTVVYTATDASGNTTTCNFTITVTDAQLPVIVNCPANISLNNDAGVCGAVATWGTPSVNDNCPNPTLTQTAGLASGSVFPIGTTTVEYTATDANGNTAAVCSFTVTVTDNENPVITNCPANIAVNNDAGVCGATVTWVTPTMTDNCPGATLVQTQGAASGTVFPLGTSTIEYTATDAAGNTAICTFTITITDNELPVIVNCPANIAVNNDVGVCGATVTWTAPTVTDNCPNPTITQTAGPASGSVFPLGTTTIEYTATDANGNTAAICSFTVTVTDNENPMIAGCPANIAVNNDAGVCGATVTWATPTVSDNCPNPVIAQTAGAASGTVFPLGTSTIEYTATDANGNTAICTFTITVTDNELPVIANCPANISLNNDAGVCGAVATWTAPTVSDNCPNPTLTQTAGLASGSVFPIGTTTVEYTATDANGNTAAVCSFTVTVTDNENPVITNCPANIAVNNDAGVCGATITWVTPTMTDNCPGATLVQTQGAASGTVFPLGTSTIEYTATDANGNTAICTFTITITDNELPVIVNCPANISLNNDAGVCGAVATWTAPTVTDNCPNPTITQTAGPASGSVFPLGTTTIEYTATDANGNTAAICSFTVTVTDNENPMIVGCPANIAVNNDAGVCGATVTWATPTVSDNCPNPVIAQTAGAASGTVFPLGTSTIEYTATDANGNTAICTFTITVTDNELPVIANCPANISLNNDAGVCGAVATWTAPTVSDNCPNPTLTQTAGLASGSVFPIGTTTVEYTATDANGNTAAVCSFTVTVTDNENPVITNCPANIAVNNDAGVCGATVTWVTPTVTDNCSVSFSQTAGAISGSFFPLGTSTITYTATDPSGNTATCTFTITVTDNQLPVISGCPTNISLSNDAGICGAVATWTAPTVSDNCPNPTITQIAGPASGSVFPIGTTTITYSATDANGNAAAANCSFTITVNDTENPVINNCPANISVNNDAGVCGAAVTWTAPSVTDNCPGAAIVQTQGAVSGSVFPVGNSIITYTATDAAGNDTTCSFTITVTDNQPPTIANCPANINLNVGANCNGVVNWVAPTITDNCAGVTFTSTHTSGSTFNIGTTTVTYTATDAVGLTATCSFTVTLTDNLPPIIANCPSNMVLNLAARCDTIVSWTAPTATDNCGIPTLTNNLNPGSTFPIGVTTVNYIATDASGNKDTCTFTVTVIAPPALVATLDSLIYPNCNGEKGKAVVSATGGSGAYTYTWVPSNPVNNTNTAMLSAGNYIVTIKDALANACVQRDTLHVAIIQPAVLNETFVKTNLNCYNDNSGSITINATGGTQPYSYSWSHNPTLNVASLNNLAAGTYTITTKDAKGCTVTKSVAITEPDSLSLQTTQTDVKCFGKATGKASIVVDGGTTPYSYSWAGSNSTNANAINLTAGNYTAYVTDAKGCKIDHTFVIAQPTTALNIATTATPAKCFGDNSGSANVVAQGGTAPYTYTWSSTPPQYTTTASGLVKGTYNIKVFDANNCFENATVVIGQPMRLEIENLGITHPYCDSTNGAAIVDANGGTLPYSFVWKSTPPQFGQTANNLPSGTVEVVVQDGSGCKDSLQMALINTPPASALYSSNPNHLEPLVVSNAQIEFENLSTGAVAYSWSFGDGFVSTEKNPDHGYAVPGTYTVTLTAYNSYMTCPTTYSQTYEVVPNGQVFIPNTFTPNNDGKNDEFFIGGEGIRKLECKIFDRWGKVIYILQSPTDVWSGKDNKGIDVPEGVYSYIIKLEFFDNRIFERAGTITILR